MSYGGERQLSVAYPTAPTRSQDACRSVLMLDRYQRPRGTAPFEGGSLRLSYRATIIQQRVVLRKRSTKSFSLVYPAAPKRRPTSS